MCTCLAVPGRIFVNIFVQFLHVVHACTYASVHRHELVLGQKPRNVESWSFRFPLCVFIYVTT